MALYNPSSFLTTIKEDIEIEDLPLPVNDAQIWDHITRKSLVDFSIIYPIMKTFFIGEEQLNKKSKESYNYYYEYTIPKWVYDDTEILTVTKIDVARPNGYSDFFIPNANWSTPDAVIAAMADVRMAAGVASSLAKAPTYKFEAPNTIKLFNGWAGGIYEVEVGLKHDPSLATIPPGAFTTFRKLVTLDVQAYLYGKLKRKDRLDVGIGNFELKLDEWQNSKQEYNDYIKELEDTAVFDVSHIYRY